MSMSNDNSTRKSEMTSLDDNSTGASTTSYSTGLGRETPTSRAKTGNDIDTITTASGFTDLFGRYQKIQDDGDDTALTTLEANTLNSGKYTQTTRSGSTYTKGSGTSGYMHDIDPSTVSSFNPSLSGIFTESVEDDTIRDTHTKSETKTARKAARDATTALSNGRSFDSAVETVTTAITSLWTGMGSVTTQTNNTDGTDTLGAFKKQRSKITNKYASANKENIGPVKIKEIQELSHNWAMISVSTAFAVLGAGGKEKTAQAAATAVLLSGRKSVENGLDPNTALNNAAADSSTAVLSKGGNKKIAAAAAVAVMENGSSTIPKLKKNFAKLSEKEQRLEKKKKIQDAKRRDKEKKTKKQIQRQIAQVGDEKNRLGKKVEALKQTIKNFQVESAAADEERKAKEKAMIQRLAEAEEEKASMIETIQEIREADAEREAEKMKMSAMLQQLKGAMEKKIAYAEAVEDRRRQQEEELYHKVAETEAEKTKLVEKINEIQREEAIRQKKEMTLMERMAAAEADKARLAEKMKSVKNVMEERRRAALKEENARKKNEEELLLRMQQAEEDKARLNNQIRFLNDSENERKRKEYELLQKMTSVEAEKARLLEKLKGLDDIVRKANMNIEITEEEKKKNETALMKEMAAAEAEKTRYTEKLLQLQHSENERKRNEIALNERLQAAEEEKVILHSKMMQIQHAEAIFKKNEQDFLRKMEVEERELKMKQEELANYAKLQIDTLQHREKEAERQRTSEMEKISKTQNNDLDVGENKKQTEILGKLKRKAEEVVSKIPTKQDGEIGIGKKIMGFIGKRFDFGWEVNPQQASNHNSFYSHQKSVSNMSDLSDLDSRYTSLGESASLDGKNLMTGNSTYTESSSQYTNYNASRAAERSRPLDDDDSTLRSLTRNIEDSFSTDTYQKGNRSKSGNSSTSSIESGKKCHYSPNNSGFKAQESTKSQGSDLSFHSSKSRSSIKSGDSSVGRSRRSFKRRDSSSWKSRDSTKSDRTDKNGMKSRRKMETLPTIESVGEDTKEDQTMQGALMSLIKSPFSHAQPSGKLLLITPSEKSSFFTDSFPEDSTKDDTFTDNETTSKTNIKKSNADPHSLSPSDETNDTSFYETFKGIQSASSGLVSYLSSLETKTLSPFSDNTSRIDPIDTRVSFFNPNSDFEHKYQDTRILKTNADEFEVIHDKSYDCTDFKIDHSYSGTEYHDNEIAEENINAETFQEECKSTSEFSRKRAEFMSSNEDYSSVSSKNCQEEIGCVQTGDDTTTFDENIDSFQSGSFDTTTVESTLGNNDETYDMTTTFGTEYYGTYDDTEGTSVSCLTSYITNDSYDNSLTTNQTESTPGNGSYVNSNKSTQLSVRSGHQPLFGQISLLRKGAIGLFGRKNTRPTPRKQGTMRSKLRKGGQGKIKGKVTIFGKKSILSSG